MCGRKQAQLGGRARAHAAVTPGAQQAAAGRRLWRSTASLQGLCFCPGRGMTKASPGTTALGSDRAPGDVDSQRSSGVSEPLPEACQLCPQGGFQARYLRIKIMDTQGRERRSRVTQQEGAGGAPEQCPVPLAWVQPVTMDSRNGSPPHADVSRWMSSAGEEGVSSPGEALGTPHRNSGKERPSTCRGGRGCWLSLCEPALGTCTELLPREPRRTREVHPQWEQISLLPNTTCQPPKPDARPWSGGP